MREGSALLERLEKRFESIDDRADRRSVGMRERDSFLSHFSDRMKGLESLVQVPRCLLSVDCPNWGILLIHGAIWVDGLCFKIWFILEWLAEQEIEEEEIEQPRVSAWGTATSSSERREDHRRG